MVPLLDTHQHLVYPDRQRYAWMAGAPALNGKAFTLADYKVLTAGAGIAGSLFMEVDVDDWRDEAAMVAALAAGEGSGILGTVAACRPETDAGFDAWLTRWRAAGPDADAMGRVNPVYIPRNHLVEEALAAATDGDLAPLTRLLEAVGAPFEERSGLERYAEPAPVDFGAYRTFCGT